MLINRIVEQLQDQAITDIHLAVKEPMWTRRLGELRRVSQEPLEDAELRQFLQSYTDGESIERLLGARGGSHDFAITVEATRLRCNLARVAGGLLSLKLRRLRDAVASLAELGLPEALRQQVDRSKGLIFVTGPTGSGKSTTLAACVNHINRTRAGHIITIEDPLEYVVRSERCMVTRREVGRDVESFDHAVRAAMRQDPDVIVIGEVRDRETMRAAFNAAETGHLVLATLHTINAPKTVDRVTSFFQEEEQHWARAVLSTVLNAVLSQALIRTRSGTLTLACELLVNTPAVRQHILENKVAQIQNLMFTGRQDGQVLMQQSLARKVREGLITREDAAFACEDPALLDKELAR